MEPLGERTVSTKIFANVSLQPNQFLKGEYAISSFAPQTTGQIKITRAVAESVPAKIELQSLVPLALENSLLIEATLENKGTETGNIEFVVRSAHSSYEKKETINGLETKILTITIENYKTEPYTIRISADELDFEKTIELQETTPKEQQQTGQNNEQQQGSVPTQLPGRLPAETPIIIAVVAAICTIAIVLKFLHRQ